jgi:hypothetical protein
MDNPFFDKDKTNVVGYFNQQKWPVHVHISEVNLSRQLTPGAYIVDRQGRKVNDPRLEVCVGPNALAREFASKGTTVPILRMVSREPVRSTSGQTVSSATAFVKDNTGQLVPKFSPASAPGVPPSPSKSSVMGMSVEDAKRMGLIRPTRPVVESNLTDTDGAPVQGAAPTIDEITPTDVRTPGELRRLKAGGKPVTPITPIASIADLKPKPENAKLAQVLSETVVQEPSTDLAAVTRETIKAANLPAVQPTPAPQPAAVTPILQSGVDLPQPNLPDVVDVSDVTTDAELAAAAPPPAVRPVVNTPQPPTQPVQVSEVASRPNDNPTAGSSRKFVCSADNREFAYRSELARWAKRKYPAQFDQIMAPYPKSR